MDEHVETSVCTLYALVKCTGWDEGIQNSGVVGKWGTEVVGQTVRSSVL